MKKLSCTFPDYVEEVCLLCDGNSGSEGFSGDSPSTVIGMVGNNLYLAANVNDSIESHPPK